MVIQDATQRPDERRLADAGRVRDLVADGWTDIFRKVSVMFDRGGDGLSPEEAGRMVELADFEKMEEIRARVDATVKDPETPSAETTTEGGAKPSMRVSVVEPGSGRAVSRPWAEIDALR